MPEPKALQFTPSAIFIRRHGRESDGLAPLVREMRDAAKQHFARIVDDGNYTDVGKRARRTDYAKMELPKIRQRLQETAKRRREAERDLRKIHEERRPVAATEFEKTTVLQLLRDADAAALRGNQVEAKRIRDALTVRDPSPDVFRLQVALTELPALVIGVIGAQYQTLIQSRINVDLGPQGIALAEEIEAIEAETGQLLEMRGHLIRSSDHAALEEAGLVEQPPTQWSAEKRREFIEQHGAAAYQERLRDEARERLAPPAIPRPDGIGLSMTVEQDTTVRAPVPPSGAAA